VGTEGPHISIHIPSPEGREHHDIFLCECVPPSHSPLNQFDLGIFDPQTPKPRGEAPFIPEGERPINGVQRGLCPLGGAGRAAPIFYLWVPKGEALSQGVWGQKIKTGPHISIAILAILNR